MLQTKAEVDTFLDNWTAALRSGKYRQGTGVLKNLSGDYCCLGVACEVLGLEFTTSDLAMDPYVVDERGDAHTAFLPPATEDAISSHYPDLLGGTATRWKGPLDYSLVTLNDGGEHDFNQIADVIDIRRGKRVRK